METTFLKIQRFEEKEILQKLFMLNVKKSEGLLQIWVALDCVVHQEVKVLHSKCTLQANGE